jgi:hypothetical protein
MIHVDKGNEGSEYVQFDDYYINNDDYISDTPGQDSDAVGAFAHHDLPIHALNILGTTKIEDEDNIQKERHNIRNAKRAACRRRVSEQHQHQPANLYDCPTSDLRTIINAGQDARNVIIARQEERDEVEAYSPTNYHIPLDYLGTTRKRKPKVGEQPTRRKKTLSSKERFEEALHKRCSWHPKSKRSTFKWQTLRRGLATPPLNKDYEER